MPAKFSAIFYNGDNFFFFLFFFRSFCFPAHKGPSEMRPALKKDITKTRLFKNIENFTTKKWKFSDKNSDIFHISAQNIDCWYSLEPARRGGSNEYP